MVSHRKALFVCVTVRMDAVLRLLCQSTDELGGASVMENLPYCSLCPRCVLQGAGRAGGLAAAFF